LNQYYLAIAYQELGENNLAQNQIETLKSQGDSILTISLINQAINLGLKNKDAMKRLSALAISKIESAEKNGEQTNELTNEFYRALGQGNPFLVDAVLASAQYFNRSDELRSEAYDILLKAIDTNPYSEKLIKAYIEQCFMMNYLSYAESALMKLLDVITMDEFKEFEIVFDERRREVELAADENWE
jgi:hypothetical protein